MRHMRKDRRKDRQQEAVERQREHDALTVTEKLAKAKSRPGQSKKETARLWASDSEQAAE